MAHKIKIGISSCLLGNNVRYDGGHKLDQIVIDALGPFVEWVPVCPEVESGLPVPREAMQLIGDPKAHRLIMVATGIDHTDMLHTWSRKKIRLLEQERLCGYVFKSRSPSCGIDDAEISSLSGEKIVTGPGIFAQVFKESCPSIPLEDEGGLQDSVVRENFLKRAFHYAEKRVGP